MDPAIIPSKPRRHWAHLLALWTSFCFHGIGTAHGLDLPPGFAEQTIASGWVDPVGVAIDPSPQGTGRLYVWERAGRVWIVENGVKVPTPLIDIGDEVGNWGDHGLLGCALHPNFSQNGFIYLFYVVDRHHLLNAGTPAYDTAANEYFAATIGRITRYRARASDGFRSVDPESRKVLVGESTSTGFPILQQTHGVGQLVFGNDGTLLASCGEAANFYEVDNGSNPALSYAAQALSDGILQPKENVGSFRSQLVDSLDGKVVRLDPETGDGIPGNPFFDPAHPRAARSRVWALGFRNPYRFTVEPESGSHDPAAADPGVILLGDVGWGAWEEIDVIDGPGKNCGWPLFEGLTSHASFEVAAPANPDAPNPLGGFFTFHDLLIQETLATPTWPNPLDPSQQIPENVTRFMHLRPVIDAAHFENPSGKARTGIFHDTTAGEIAIGDPGSPVAGPQFGANASTAGVFYTGADFPASYRGAYFHADYGHGWIKVIVLDANHRPTQVSDFASGGAPVFIATHPAEGGLYVVDYSDATVRRIIYAPGGNQPPRAVATADRNIGPSPLGVAFRTAGSVDPDGLPLTYRWDFGDGTTSNEAEPAHVFIASDVRRFDVALSVTDAGGATAQTGVAIFVNHSLPQVELLSPVDGAKYPLTGTTAYTLTRRVIEVPGHPTATQWRVFLHHNEHEHGEPPISTDEAVALVSPIHGSTETYYYRLQLTVTDDLGAAVHREARLFPNVINAPPQIAWSLSARNLTAGPQPQVLDAAATLADVDSPGIESGSLRVNVSSGSGDDSLSIVPEGAAPGQVSLEGNRVTFGGVAVGIVSGGASPAEPLVVSFNEAATPLAARAIVRRIAGKFAQAGARTVLATLDDGDGGIVTTAPLALSVQPSPVQQWMAAHFGENGDPAIAGYTADPDGDELVNLLEYALGLDPLVADAGHVVVDLETIGADRFLRLTVTKNPAATDVTFSVEATGGITSPASWSILGTTVEINSNTTLRVRDNTPISSAGQRYLRLKIALP